jgi:hypothetical protein
MVEICRAFEGTNCLLLQGRMGTPRLTINIEDVCNMVLSSHHLPDYTAPHPIKYFSSKLVKGVASDILLWCLHSPTKWGRMGVRRVFRQGKGGLIFCTAPTLVLWPT